MTSESALAIDITSDKSHIKNNFLCCSLLTLPFILLQMDYRALVHEKDEATYSEIRVILLDIRGFYVSRLV